MPMLETAAFNLNAAFAPTKINATAADAGAFAPGMPLRADFVYPAGSAEYGELTTYLGLMPAAVKESIRATIYFALTRNPAVPVTFTWRPGYYFSVAVAQLPATKVRQGAINLAIEGPLPNDRFSVMHLYSVLPESEMAMSRKSARSGAPSPAKRKPSRRSRKSS